MTRFSPPTLQPVTVIVTDITIENGIHIEAPFPLQVRAQVGQEVHLKVRYRFYESSRARERAHIVMKSHIDHHCEPPREVHLRDIPLHEDVYLGVLEQHYTLDTPGDHTGEIHIIVSYEEGPWSGTTEPEGVDEEVRGEIRIQVR